MDFRKIITENLPEGIEIPKANMNVIVDAIKRMVGDSTLPKEWHSDKKAEWEAEKQKLELELNDLKSGDNGVEVVKAALEAEKTAHTAAKEALAAKDEEVQNLKDGHAKEKTLTENTELVRNLLLTEKDGVKFAEAFISKALKDCPHDLIKRDKDGGLKNPDEVLAFYQKEWSAGFGTVTTQGVPSANPPKGDNTKNPWLPEHRSLAEQTRIFRENPELARQMMAAGVRK